MEKCNIAEFVNWRTKRGNITTATVWWLLWTFYGE